MSEDSVADLVYASIHTYSRGKKSKSPPFLPLACGAVVCVRAAEIQYTASHKPFSHRILRSFTCHWNSVYLTCTTYCDTHTHTHMHTRIHIYPASVQSYLWAAYFRKKLCCCWFALVVDSPQLQFVALLWCVEHTFQAHKALSVYQLVVDVCVSGWCCLPSVLLSFGQHIDAYLQVRKYVWVYLLARNECDHQRVLNWI